MRVYISTQITILLSAILTLTDAQDRCSPIFVRWSRVRLNLTPRVSGPYSREVCADACSRNEHPARQGYQLNCGGFNHKQGVNSLAHDCQIYQMDQLFNIDGRAEADDRYAFYWKYCIKTKKVCQSPYQFTFFTDRYMDNKEVLKSVNTFSLEDCLAKCLDEDEFTCRSASYNRTDGGCHMSAQNQLSKPGHIRVNNDPNFRIDYYESNCYNSSFEMSHKCDRDGITVTVDSKLAYTGALYGLYDYFTCRLEPVQQKHFSLHFPFPSRLEKRGNCSDSMRLKGKDIILDVVLSTDGVEPLYFITPEDLTYQAVCPLPSHDKKYISKDKSGATLQFVKDTKKISTAKVEGTSTIPPSTTFWPPIFTIPSQEFTLSTHRPKDMFTLPVLDDFSQPLNPQSGVGSRIEVHVKIPSIHNNVIDWNESTVRSNVYRVPKAKPQQSSDPENAITQVYYTIPPAAFTSKPKVYTATKSTTTERTTVVPLTTETSTTSTTTTTTSKPTTTSSTTQTSTTSTSTSTPPTTTTSTTITTPTTRSTTTSTTTSTSTPPTTSTTNTPHTTSRATTASSDHAEEQVFHRGTLTSRLRIQPAPTPSQVPAAIPAFAFTERQRSTTSSTVRVTTTYTSPPTTTTSTTTTVPTTTSTTTITPSTTTTTTTTTTPSTTTTTPKTTTTPTTTTAPSTTTTPRATTTTTSIPTTTKPLPTTTTIPTTTTTVEPPQPILFDIFHGGQPIEAVVVGTSVTLSFTPFFAIPPEYMTVAECQVEPVQSQHSWERQPLPIVKNNCQADQVGLVCPPDRTDFGMRVKVEAFRYQTTAKVRYTCLVRVCPNTPCPKVFCPAVDGCEQKTLVNVPAGFRRQNLISHVREKRQSTLEQLAEFLQRGNGNFRIPYERFNSPGRPSSQVQQHLNSLAGDHVVTKQLTVANSENELQYYLRTGTIPKSGLSPHFEYFGGRR